MINGVFRYSIHHSSSSPRMIAISSRVSKTVPNKPLAVVVDITKHVQHNPAAFNL